VIDLHTHVLPGVDDGPATMDESLELLRAAEADGIATMAATPHVRDDYPTAPETMERLVAAVNAAAHDAGISVEVLPGGELDLEYLQRLDNATLRRFGLGGNPNVLLVETPYHGWPLGLQDVVFRLALRGFSVVLAHPERNADVQANPELLEPLVAAGMLVQLTAASVDGRVGRRTQTCAHDLLGARLAHLLASDAHASSVRATGLTAAAEAIAFPELVDWLTRDSPARLLAGTPLSAPPERRRAPRLRVPWRG
jgi:protein-tyrosine phosphatase